MPRCRLPPQNLLRLITIGVGIDNYNDYLPEQLAQQGNGWYRYLDTPEQARALFARENWLTLSTPFADQARVQVTWNPDLVYSWRIVGYENRVTADENFTQNRREFAEIPSGAATTVFYELRLTQGAWARTAETIKLGDVEVRWVEPATGVSREQYGTVSGRWRRELDSLGDPALSLGTAVALAADRYSEPAIYLEPGYLGAVLTGVEDWMADLERHYGGQAAYRDFVFLLEHMVATLPEVSYYQEDVPEVRPPAESGYSP